MTTYARMSQIARDVLARTGLPYELAGIEMPTDLWGIWTLTFLDPGAPLWARTFQLPLEWEAGTTEEAAGAALERLLRDHGRTRRNPD
ncbi:MAG TPA: hypothetical protein VND92_02960 [Vicinamibacterales bacterium]|nr:hypothetical protein [Vicinamibacterales bacterium]